MEGYRRIQAAPELIAKFLRDGVRACVPGHPVPDDLKIIDARWNWREMIRDPLLEILVQSEAFTSEEEIAATAPGPGGDLYGDEQPRWRAPVWHFTWTAGASRPITLSPDKLGKYVRAVTGFDGRVRVETSVEDSGREWREVTT